MEGLLLGTLGYIGNNYSDVPTNNKNNNELDNYYVTNLENNIHQIDRMQAKNLSQTPEFYQQFDSLKFDDIGGPSCINEANKKKSGYDFSLQRELDFKNGYSNFQDKDMHYGVVSMEDFTHNNMVPFTKRRDLSSNYKNANMKYQKHTGNNPFWKHKKETECFFEPFRDLTYTNGMPVFTEELSNRYLASSKNNFGNLPFQTGIKVLPGIGDKNAAPYGVSRVLPRNIDELRSEINQKVTYINKPLETIKKGDMRGIDPNITKYKLPSYREIKGTDLVQNAGVTNGMTIRGQCNAESQRGEDEFFYTGPANDSVQGNKPDARSHYFTESKRENYENDNTHAVNAVNVRPVMTNIDSYTTYENERDTTSKDLRASGITNNNHASYYIDRGDIAKITLKEQNINKPLVSNINSTFQQGHVKYTDEAKETVRQTTINKPLVSNVNSTFQQGHVIYTDKAKDTVRQTTINKPLVSNVNSSFQQAHVTYTDSTKKTTKETTIDKPFVSNINSTFQQSHLTYTDLAKKTTKETTINKKDIANISSIKQYIYSNLNDEAKKTTKETIIDKPLVSNISSVYQNSHIQLTDEAKPTQKQTTVIKVTNTNITPIEYKGHVKNNDIAKETIKQTTINNDYISNTTTDVKGTYSNLDDNAKKTIKQTTINNNYISNTTTDVKGTYSNLDDIAKETIRQSTINKNYIGNTTKDVKSTYSNLDDIAKETIRQSTINNDYISNTTTDVKGTYSNLEDIAKETIKQSTINNNHIANTTTDVKGIYSNLEDSAKETIKQSTINNDYIGNTTKDVKGVYINLNDNAKETIKQTTIDKKYIGGTVHEIKGTYSNITDDIKTTVKQTTVYTTPVKNISSQISTVYSKNDEEARTTIKETVLHEGRSHISDLNKSTYVLDNDNEARDTLKETTIHNDYIGNANTNVKLPKSEQAERNMVIDDRREITANFNRPANAKSDQIRGNINAETVRFNDKRQLFGYVSIPKMTLDNNITPFAKVHTDRKTNINDTNEYRMDPIFIDTLNDNPLVNDIYHQKNYKF